MSNGPKNGMKNDDGERIAKVLARAGLCSRREAERAILDGRVTVNGKRLDTPAIKVTAKHKITFDGKPVGEAEETQMWMYHKPTGLMTTHKDPQGRPTVFDSLPKDLPRVISIGRLDINSEGLLLLTNDGSVARKLELPSTGWLRRYRVRVRGQAEPEKLEQLAKGVTVEGVKYGAISATLERQMKSNAWLTVSLREGKNREVRRVFEHLGLEVSRLIRVSYGPFKLGTLESGQVKKVPRSVLSDQLGDTLGLPQKQKPEPKPTSERSKPRAHRRG
jgi:23S rRNA pseudouridine2605 synthase